MTDTSPATDELIEHSGGGFDAHANLVETINNPPKHTDAEIEAARQAIERMAAAKNSVEAAVEPARYLDTRSGAVVTPKYYNSVISSRDMFEPLYTAKQLQALATPVNSRAEPVGSLHVDEYGGYDFDLTQSLSEGGYDLFTHPTPADSPDTPVVAVKPMRLSDDRVDYYVSIQVGTREVTPHVFGAEYKAAYHVALYDWLLNGGNEPDILAFDEDDFPAQKTVANSRAEAIGVKPLEWLSDREPFFASTPFCTYRISPVNDDTGPHWQTSVAYQGSTYRRHETAEAAKAAAQADYEQRIRSALLDKPQPDSRAEAIRECIAVVERGVLTRDLGDSYTQYYNQAIGNAVTALRALLQQEGE